MRTLNTNDILKTLNVFNSLLYSSFKFSQIQYTIYDYVNGSVKKKPKISSDNKTSSNRSKMKKELVSQSKCLLILEIRTETISDQFLNKMYRILLENISIYKNFKIIFRKNFKPKINLMGNLNLNSQKYFIRILK